MTKSTLKTAIRGIDNLETLNELSSLISDCKTMLGRTTLSEGSQVWVVQKTKRTTGVITKMNRTKAVVDMNGMSYRVPFSMLTARI